jgi:hypothetical protein
VNHEAGPAHNAAVYKYLVRGPLHGILRIFLVDCLFRAADFFRERMLCFVAVVETIRLAHTQTAAAIQTARAVVEAATSWLASCSFFLRLLACVANGLRVVFEALRGLSRSCAG